MNKVVAVLILSLIFTALGINMSAMTSATNWKVTINIIGSGTLTVIEKEFNASSQEWYTVTQFTVNHSTSFSVTNGTAVFLKSIKSFIVNNQGMITNEYGQLIINNTTLNVDFDAQSVKLPLSKYANVTLLFTNEGKLDVMVVNPYTPAEILYTNITINKTTTLSVPLNSEVILLAFPNLSFKLNNSPVFIQSFAFNITRAISIVWALTFSSPSTTTTSTTITTTSSSSSTASTTSVTSTSSVIITITAHTGTVIPVSTSTSSNSTVAILVVVIVVILAIAGYLVLKRR